MLKVLEAITIDGAQAYLTANADVNCVRVIQAGVCVVRGSTSGTFLQIGADYYYGEKYVA